MAALEIGSELPQISVTPDRYLTNRYAGASGDFNPIHVDQEFAQAVGLPGRILHGLWTMAQVARLATDAGGGPHSLSRLSVQFRGMGLPEQELVVSGSVVAVDGDLVTLEAQVVQGGKAIIRSATAEIDPS
ncbi:MAG: MaoC/PaaZ C-terminal domain-containing protein [Solirubrobacterales bacterium]|nr:MaoC/PaaZ C-terminal domain-containing protein [Solirubrobacterales bacterium]